MTADAAAVSADEGGTLSNTGTFSDADGNSSVTLTAKVGGVPFGTVTKNDALGTWSWSAPALDGDVGPLTVTITATDSQNAAANATFTYAVNNVPPTISLSGNAEVNEGSPYTLHLGVVSDPGQDTITSYRIYWGGGAFDDFTGNPANTIATHTYDDGPANQTHNVAVTDEDGTFFAGSLDVIVKNVDPTASFASNGPITYGQTLTVSFANQHDDSSADTAFGFHYAYSDTGDFTGVTYAGGSSTDASHDYTGLNAGDYTFYARIIDKDDGYREYSRFVTVGKADATVEVEPVNVTYDGNPQTATVISITGVNGESWDMVGTVDLSNTTHTSAGTYGDAWSFAGTGNYNDIAGTPITDTISPAETDTIVSSMVNPAIDGQDVAFTATVSNTQTGAIPTGTIQFAVDGANIGGPVPLINGVATSPSITVLAGGEHPVTATYSDATGNFSASTNTFSGQIVVLLAAQNLQAVLAVTSAVTLHAPLAPNLQGIISAINGLAPIAPRTATITIMLGSGSYSDATFSPPAGVTVILIGNGTTTTFVGHSPAFQVTQGVVSVFGVTFTTATKDPAVLISGGRLTLRNTVIQESTGFTAAAVRVTGGTLDLGTAGSPGGNVLNINGLGEFVHNTTAGGVPATGNTYEVNGVAISASSLSFTALASSGASVYGQAVTLTATIRANLPGTGTPTGSVAFFDATTGANLGSVPVSGGRASLTTTALGAGDHLIRANYSGDANFTLSLDTLTQSVSRATPIVTVTGYHHAYDAASHGATGSQSGIGGESADTLDLGATFKDVPGGTAHWVFTGNGNYKDQAGDVDIVITKADATVSVAGYTTGSVTGVNSANLGTPTFKYYLASDTTFASPLTGAPKNAGSYVVVASYAGSANYTSASAQKTFSILSAQQQVTLLTASINTLVSTHVLSSLEGNIMTTTLTVATTSFNAGNRTGGVLLMNAFKVEVGLLKLLGRLTAAQAQGLISSADAIIVSA